MVKFFQLFEMVKVREFCCGCSLRSGTFAIAWCFLIYTCYLLITTLYLFLYVHRQLRAIKEIAPEIEIDIHLPSLYIFAYNVIKSSVGIAVSITALWALHKNKVKFLNGLFWYLCYIAVTDILSGILMIFGSDWDIGSVEMGAFFLFYTYDYPEIVIPFLILYTFIAGIILYFALVVKSYRDYSLRNDGLNVQFVGPDMTTVGYIQAA